MNLADIDFDASALVVARRLIGARLLIDGVGGTIVETEAYDERERASHAFNGPTARTQVLFGPSGRAYVYRSYGLHWCLNLVCRPTGHAAGVLIRAVEPTHGIDRMIERRGCEDVHRLCSGPGRVGQALGVDHALNGRRLDHAPFRLEAARDRVRTVRGTRVGITRAAELRWRFGLATSPFVSRPFR